MFSPSGKLTQYCNCRFVVGSCFMSSFVLALVAATRDKFSKTVFEKPPRC
jgi:hypothetical protein